jgi:hypothetical protein
MSGVRKVDGAPSSRMAKGDEVLDGKCGKELVSGLRCLWKGEKEVGWKLEALKLSWLKVGKEGFIRE